MRKRAGLETVMASIRSGLGNLSDAERLLLGTLVLGCGVGGGLAGALTAKGTAHTPADFDVAKQEYQNEQGKADINYLKKKLDQEYQPPTIPVAAPKSVRLLNT